MDRYESSADNIDDVVRNQNGGLHKGNLITKPAVPLSSNGLFTQNVSTIVDTKVTSSVGYHDQQFGQQFQDLKV